MKNVDIKQLEPEDVRQYIHFILHTMDVDSSDDDSHKDANVNNSEYRSEFVYDLLRFNYLSNFFYFLLSQRQKIEILNQNHEVI